MRNFRAGGTASASSMKEENSLAKLTHVQPPEERSQEKKLGFSFALLETRKEVP